MAYDQDGVKKAIKDLLIAIGEDPNRDGLQDTPDRVSRSLKELVGGLYENPKEHLKKQFKVEHDDLIIVKDIPFHSCCEHHILPFYGIVNVCYQPSDDTVVGLSKLARLVEGYSRRLQVQERLNQQIVQAICSELNPKGVLVTIEAEHTCMSMRGIKKIGSKTLTIVSRGTFSENEKRKEILDLLK